MNAPHVGQNALEVAHLVEALEASRKEKHRNAVSVKKTTFIVKDSRDRIQVDSWKFLDWDYKRRNLPTYARGLFTTKQTNNVVEITVRGYDKFFNVGEVHETKWETLMAKTQPPYELTLKENGCIIFIAGLADETLLVCSKHSTGDRAGVETSHASAGEARLAKQLATLGKTKADLARELRQRNITAVAELCDDSFEEHILPYGPDKAGLYLHGINFNTPSFATYPSKDVQDFAGNWGFLKTDYINMDDIQKVKTFLEDIANTGAYDGRDVEGFVIRCKMSANPSTLPFQDWFFKYKFEEPYLMYRQWRECTKALIARKEPRYKKHAKITEEYLNYTSKRLRADPELAKLYSQNHGIIALRNEFLEFKNLKGSDAANMDNLDKDVMVMSGVSKDVVLCPISTIGCGKTTIALALNNLFGWGHVQNDNISGKGRPPRFTKAVLDLLEQQPVVFADRNNAQRHERRQILGDTKLQNSKVKLVCLHFRHDEDSIPAIRRITQDRVLKRGDNHQTIHAASDKDKFLGVMEGFIQRFDPCNPLMPPDSGFDAVIELDPVLGSRRNLDEIIAQLNRIFPNLLHEVPTSDQVDAAIREALEYKPHLRHDIPDRSTRLGPNPSKSSPSKKKRKQLEYMAIHIPYDSVYQALENAFASLDKDLSLMYMKLKQSRRLQPAFHVTLMHRANANNRSDLWQQYSTLFESSGDDDGNLGVCDVLLERIIFDDRIMAIVVRINDAEQSWTCTNRIPHITVGTRDNSVKPKESNDILARWLKEGTTSENNIREVVFQKKPVFSGTVRGVASR